MSKYSHYRHNDFYAKRPLARSKVMGVCAGLAQQFDWDVTTVRVVAVISLFVFTAPTFLAYIVAGALFF
jgi:phage shock protein PspC (stress-responsive transcriptional regulator)